MTNTRIVLYRDKYTESGVHGEMYIADEYTDSGVHGEMYSADEYTESGVL